jgi:hypothetical protein
MDDFISIIRKSIKELGGSPALLAAGFAVGVLSLSALASYGRFDEVIKMIAADYSMLLLPLLIMPFFTGGALGYAVEVRKNGSSSLSAFISSGVKNYVRMLMAGIIALVAFYFFITGVGLFLFIGGMGDPFIGSLLGFLTLALTFLCLMAIEFYDVSIIAEGSGVIAAFRNSIGFVKRNLLAATGFFLIVLFLKFLLQMPLSFGLAGAMMTNQTYYDAMMNASNATAANSTALNMTSILSMGPVTLGTGGLVTVAAFQVILQGFVFAFLALYKTEFYLTVKARKKITDFDYDFRDEPPPP